MTDFKRGQGTPLALQAAINKSHRDAERMIEDWRTKSPGRRVKLHAGLRAKVTLCEGDSEREFCGDSVEAARGNAAEAIRGES